MGLCSRQTKMKVTYTVNDLLCQYIHLILQSESRKGYREVYALLSVVYTLINLVDSKWRKSLGDALCNGDSESVKNA